MFEIKKQTVKSDLQVLETSCILQFLVWRENLKIVLAFGIQLEVNKFIFWSQNDISMQLVQFPKIYRSIRLICKKRAGGPYVPNSFQYLRKSNSVKKGS